MRNVNHLEGGGSSAAEGEKKKEYLKENESKTLLEAMSWLPLEGGI